MWIIFATPVAQDADRPQRRGPADLIASAGDDKVIRVWNATTGTLTAALAGHTKRVRSFAFDRTGTRVLSGGEDGAR